MHTKKSIYLQKLCQIGTPLTINKGTCISSPCYEENSIYYLEEGLCALVRYTHSGEEIIYHYFKSGDLLGGVPYLLLGHPTSSFSSTQQLSQFYTKTPCKIYKIQFSTLTALIASDPEISTLITQSIASHFHSVINHFHSSKEDHTPARLCKLLANLAEYKNGKYFLHKYFTYVELAKYLGVHTVTISRIMLTLKNRGLIEKNGHCIVIKDLKQLLELADSPHLLSTTADKKRASDF